MGEVAYNPTYMERAALGVVDNPFFNTVGKKVELHAEVNSRVLDNVSAEDKVAALRKVAVLGHFVDKQKPVYDNETRELAEVRGELLKLGRNNALFALGALGVLGLIWNIPHPRVREFLAGYLVVAHLTPGVMLWASKTEMSRTGDEPPLGGDAGPQSSSIPLYPEDHTDLSSSDEGV